MLQCVEGEERETQVLQCVAVYFRRAEMCALQGVAVCCGVLQCVAVCCKRETCDAVCCSVLQCVAVCCSVFSENKERHV